MGLSRRCRKKEADSLRVHVNDEKVKRCDEVKYLGVIVVELEEAH